MFRLLAILIALHFSSEGNGAPTVVLVESGGSKNVNPSSLISDEGNLERREIQTTLSRVSEENLRTFVAEPTLKVRAINESKARRTSFNEILKPNIKPVKRTKSSSSDIDDLNKEKSALQKQKDKAKAMVSDVKKRLSKRGANPYADEMLAQLMSDAIAAYNKAYDREWNVEDFEDDDDVTRVVRLLIQFDDIVEDMKTRNGKIPELKADESDEDWLDESSSTPVGNEFLTSAQDFADKMIYKVEALLEAKRTPYYKDEGLLRKVGKAIDEYNTAFNRDWPGSSDFDEEPAETRADIFIGELEDIYQHQNDRKAGNVEVSENLLAAKGKQSSSLKKRAPSVE